MRSSLTEADFKWRLDLFYTTSREDPDKLWMVVLKENADEVVAFRARDARGHPHAWTMDAAETVNMWHEQRAAGVLVRALRAPCLTSKGCGE